VKRRLQGESVVLKRDHSRQAPFRQIGWPVDVDRDRNVLLRNSGADDGFFDRGARQNVERPGHSPGVVQQSEFPVAGLDHAEIDHSLVVGFALDRTFLVRSVVAAAKEGMEAHSRWTIRRLLRELERNGNPVGRLGRGC
jgi:hypothetical protein